QVIEDMLYHINNLKHLLQLRRDINTKVNKQLDKQQRENFIQHQIDLLQQEIGQGAVSDYNTFKERAEKKNWSEATTEHFNRELAKLQRYNQNTPDYSIQYSYLDTFLNLPWINPAEIDTDLDKIEATLNNDHFGLERVKERILEHMAVTALRNDNKSPIICLVGPPGVGKTSLGKSIANAMGREYGRVAFGGLHDEAEIRGHRRTYIGAMPGRIIAALLKTEHSNPVIVLDEIDKIGKDYKGDPSTALLEVLDPEQNSHFHDNYLDADYDLSDILFIATANSLETVSGPLRDRMEIISIPGYIAEEKIEIAKQHLLPKQLEANGMADTDITFTDDALSYLIEYYTRESGVRKLEKTIGKVLRKLAIRRVRRLDFPTTVTREVVSELLGKEEFNPEMYENNDNIGVVTGLAWTQVGGEILFIESSITEGKGKLTLTGNLGDVMKESATLALQHIKAHAADLGIDPKAFDTTDVHIHVPEGAIPKDGPSAGITMATSLASSFCQRKVRPKLAMTGEITLRGKVLPVGGIREKIIAAKRAGIEEIILSKENRKDINEIKAKYVDGLKFTFVDNVAEVLDRALL
ncbi:MAG: endopeptidase La, partial [Muribaculaceae bacterium]|nr:endopeptidase La [Muribaculaceae bacterium]